MDERWGVLVWNMALMSPGAHDGQRNMEHLNDLVQEHNIQVALLNEASVALLRGANAAAEKDGRPKPFVFSADGILGRDFWTDEHEVRKPKMRTKWSSAVMSRLGPEAISEADAKAWAPSRRNHVVDIPFKASVPGIWIAARVQIDTEHVACVSLYGLMEELSDASIHRSLSDVSPLFSDPAHKEKVLLGGDFNIGTGLSDPLAQRRSRIVLDRIEAYGLV